MPITDPNSLTIDCLMQGRIYAVSILPVDDGPSWFSGKFDRLVAQHYPLVGPSIWAAFYGVPLEISGIVTECRFEIDVRRITFIEELVCAK